MPLGDKPYLFRGALLGFAVGHFVICCLLEVSLNALYMSYTGIMFCSMEARSEVKVMTCFAK